MEAAQERRIRKGYAAFLRGDLDAALAKFLPEATFTNPDYAVETGVRTGLEDVRGGFQALYNEFEYSSVELDQMVEGPDGVLVIAHVQGRGKISGAPLDARFFHVFRFREDQVVDFAWYVSEAEGRRAVGLD